MGNRWSLHVKPMLDGKRILHVLHKPKFTPLDFDDIAIPNCIPIPRFKVCVQFKECLGTFLDMMLIEIECPRPFYESGENWEKLFSDIARVRLRQVFVDRAVELIFDNPMCRSQKIESPQWQNL